MNKSIWSSFKREETEVVKLVNRIFLYKKKEKEDQIKKFKKLKIGEKSNIKFYIFIKKIHCG